MEQQISFIFSEPFTVMVNYSRTGNYLIPVLKTAQRKMARAFDSFETSLLPSYLPTNEIITLTIFLVKIENGTRNSICPIKFENKLKQLGFRYLTCQEFLSASLDPLFFNGMYRESYGNVIEGTGDYTKERRITFSGGCSFGIESVTPNKPLEPLCNRCFAIALGKEETDLERYNRRSRSYSITEVGH